MKDRPMTRLPENILELINATLGGYNTTIGLVFVKAEPDEFVAQISVDSRHHMPYGLVHGGVYASMIETVCSTGAAITVISENKSAVGLENSTSFLHAVRSGILRCTARPLALGNRSHVWEAQVHDDSGRLVATGRVRLMILESGAQAAGETVGLDSSASDPNTFPA
ncbi:MAG: PaaI family thioesterase [Pseudomonadota bacterium]